MHSRSFILLIIAVIILGGSIMPAAWGQNVRVLFLSKSAGFEHGVIKQDEGKPSVADEVLTKLAGEHGAEITCTKDASLINAENLKNYDIVMMYTTGNLTEAGQDGTPPMGAEGLEDLIAWVEGGGGLMGFHSVSDTFHSPENGPASPFVELIGGEFKSHGKQFVGTVKSVDPSHPAMEGVPQEWRIKDEWYMFRNLNEGAMHVLALLDPGEERGVQEAYNVPAYPIIWCSEVGKGRVYHNALGHEPDVWNSPEFQQMIVAGSEWVMDNGLASAAPNYGAVVPTAVEPTAAEDASNTKEK